MRFVRFKYSNKLAVDHLRTRKLKQSFFLSKLVGNRADAALINKNYLTSVKVILTDNNATIIFIRCPLSRITGARKKYKYGIGKKKNITKFKFNKRALLKSRRGTRNRFIKRIKQRRQFRKIKI